jgi:hypothetical protein
MKRLFLLLSVACGLALSGCEKDLEQSPISNGSVPDFYKTAVDFDQAMTAVYSQLRGYPDRALFMSELRSDNMYAISAIGSRDWDGINNFATTLSINPYVSDTWASDYSTIFRANTLLDQLAANGAVTGSLRVRYEAEAKFIRAFMYFDLVRMFGKVPIIDHALIPQEVAQIPRADVAKVYDLIISDLQTAITNLPATYALPGANLGRATQNAAKGMLALVYLTRSGPTYGINGPGLDSKEFDKASALLDQVIASKIYSLQPNYANIFSYTNENNSEVLFDIQFIANGSLGTDYPGIVVPDGYFSLNGVPYASGAVEIKPCSNDLVNTSYAANDVRKTFNIQQGYTYQGITETRPFYKKYLNPAGRGTSRTDWPINFIVMRYTDILMMKAECLVRGVGGTTADAVALVNPIRARAGQPALTTIDLPGLMEERRREFADECLRWHDLVRSGLVLTVMNAWIPKDDVSNKIARNIGPNNIIYPVPQVELSSSPGLYDQNPGY